MEQKINTIGLIESAIMSALISIVVILSSYFSFLYGIAMIVLPIIVAIVYYRHGLKYDIGCIIVSIILISLLFNPITAVTMGTSYGIIGTVLGYSVSKKYSSYKILVLTVISSGIALVIDFALTGLIISDQNIFAFMKSQAKEISDMFAVSIDQTMSMYESIGIKGQQIELMNQMKTLITPEFMLMLFPAIIILTSFLQGYVCIILFSIMLRKLRCGNLKVMRFSEFYVTNLVGAVLIGIMCISLILYGRGVSWGITVYNSVYMIAIIILGINGIAATMYLLINKLMLPKFVRVLIIIGAFVMGLFIVFPIMGFVEMLLDFRKLDPHRLRKA